MSDVALSAENLDVFQRIVHRILVFVVTLQFCARPATIARGRGKSVLRLIAPSLGRGRSHSYRQTVAFH